MAEAPSSTRSNPPAAIILAAGKGTRMAGHAAGEDLPKVVYEVAGEPMIRWVVRACRDAGVGRCVVVIGFKGDLIREALADEAGCEFVVQSEQLGTGHATRMAEPQFKGTPATDVFVLAGDGPLIRATTLLQLLEAHRSSAAAATLATSQIEEPAGYGRVIRDEDGGFGRIVEQKDATPEQLRVREINPSYYCFRSDLLFSALADVENRNAAGEYYLTDVPALLKKRGETVTVVEAVPPSDVLGINTPEDLAKVDRLMRDRVSMAAIAGGKP
jgi:bifunctional UDP-N-acetylglucosamine pyrophosphorylase/glucosamine-1-phosphate N-acetyltransferase